MATACLRWTREPNRPPTEHVLEAAETLIGRRPDADIVVALDGVSRNHAKIVRNSYGYAVIDLNSTNGTFVNGEQVRDHQLRPGDKISLGIEGIELLFQPLEDEKTPAPSTDIEDASFDELATKPLGIWGGETADKTLRGLASVLPSEESPYAETVLPADAPSRSELEKISYILDFHCYFEKTFSSEKTFRQILKSALEISGAERGFILARQNEEFHYALGLDGKGGLLPQSDFQTSQSVVGRVAEEGKAVFMTEGLSEEFAQRKSILAMNLRAVACLPLEVLSSESERPEVLGILYLDSTQKMHALTGLDEKILTKLADEAGAVLEKLQMIKGLEERKKIEAEMELAEQTQRSLLPQSLPILENFKIRTFSQPTRHVGGDFYDFLSLPSGELVGVLADVSGKGISAALLGSLLQGALNAEFQSTDKPAEILNRVNKLVHQKSQTSRFVTLFLFLMDRHGSGQFVGAGHNPAYLFRAATGDIEQLISKGLILGMFDFASYESSVFHLHKGDVLLVYSDGLTEAQNQQEEMFGEECVQEIICKQAPAGIEALETTILSAIEEFTRGKDQSDDITFVLVQRCD